MAQGRGRGRLVLLNVILSGTTAKKGRVDRSKYTERQRAENNFKVGNDGKT